MEMLKLEHVSKSFGSQCVLQDISLSVAPHSVYGFIGQNGAGKTTTMKMILGLLRADQGRILVHGEPVKFGQTPTNRYIGYVSDVPEFYGYMNSIEYLSLCADITGIEKASQKKRIEEVLALVHLDCPKKRIHGFSRGMKQRLGIAQALLHEPKLLICDEPTSALDPIGRKEILDILSTVKVKTTVLFSTHILSDVERICDTIGLLHNGALAIQGTMEELKSTRHSDGFEIEFRKKEDAQQFFERFTGGCWVDSHQILYPDKVEQDMMLALQAAQACGVYPQRMEMREPTLESLFLEVVGK